MMDRGEVNAGNTAYREENYYVGWRGVNSRMSLYSSLVSSYLSVLLFSDDSSSVQRKALCIFHSCNSVKLSMAEIQIIGFLPKHSFFFHCSLFLYLFPVFCCCCSLFNFSWFFSFSFTKCFWNFPYISKMSFSFISVIKPLTLCNSLSLQP